MSIEEKVLMANVWSVKKDIKRELFEMAYQDWRAKRDRLQRRKDIVTGIGFVLWIFFAGVAVSILWGGVWDLITELRMLSTRLWK